MRNLFFDTNFIVDYFLRQEFSQVCKDVLKKALENNDNLYVSYLSIANFAYIARKLPVQELYELLEKILEIFFIVDNDKIQIESAIKIKAKDFEDVLQYQSAISSNCDYIITRNPKDFYFSEIEILSPLEFLKLN